MTTLVRIKGGVVTDRILTGPDGKRPLEVDEEGNPISTSDVWIENDTAQIGWSYDGQSFWPPPSQLEPAKTDYQLRNETFDTTPEVIDLATRARTATNAQIDAWLLANVTTLAQARGVLGAVIKRLIAKGLL